MNDKDTKTDSKEEGTVKWFDSQKNFGFIGREGKDDVFVHANALEGISITEGDRVKFNVEQGEKGPSAVNVELA